MKIGIITFHFPYNCGAMLQCAALQTALEKKGHEVEVIDYRPWYHQNRYTPRKNPMVFAKSCYAGKEGNAFRKFLSGCRGYGRIVLSWKDAGKKKDQDSRFKNFRVKHLHTGKVYRNIEALKKNPPKCDLYVSGSDQLWNAHITNGELEEAYFMTFGGPEIGRITYSVGADFSECKPGYEEELKKLLAGIDSIALRESKWLPVIEQCAPDKPTAVTVDPTFLLQKDEYDAMITDKELETEPFIFTYTMPNDTQAKINNAAKIFGEKIGMKVIDASGDPKKWNLKVEDHRLCGPDEFLWYMKHASYVFTNSFHGTAFSVIMEKQFYVIPHSQTGNRAVELLEKVGLQSRIATSGNEAANRMTNPIDYEPVRRNKAALREESMSYLLNCIEKYGKKSGK